jgi:hypothetical protein
MPEPRQLSLDPPVAPGRVLPRHPDDQRLDRGPGGRPPRPASAGVVPLAGDKVTVPAQKRGRSDGEDLRPPAAAHQPRQRRKPDPVGVAPPQPAGQLTAQHLVLMPQHQQLGILGQVRPDQHRQQAEQVPHQAIDERQQHPAMVPATPLIPQRNPSSRHKRSFRAGHLSYTVPTFGPYKPDGGDEALVRPGPTGWLRDAGPLLGARSRVRADHLAAAITGVERLERQLQAAGPHWSRHRPFGMSSAKIS